MYVNVNVCKLYLRTYPQKYQGEQAFILSNGRRENSAPIYSVTFGSILSSPFSPFRYNFAHNTVNAFCPPDPFCLGHPYISERQCVWKIRHYICYRCWEVITAIIGDFHNPKLWEAIYFLPNICMSLHLPSLFH